jgi:hypothetical protein
MATHDYIISNASGAAVRADLNNALAAIATNNSSATEPTTTYAYQWWADTGSSPTVMKLRNATNSAWITLFQLDGEWSLIPFENGTAAAPSIYFKDSGTDTGIYSPGTDQVAITTGGTGRLFVTSAGSVGIGSSAPSSLLEVSSATTSYIRSSSTTNSISGIIGAATSSFDVGTTSSHAMNFYTAGVNRATLDTSGRLLVSLSSSIESTSKLQVKDGSLNIYHASAAAGAGYAIFFTSDGSSSALAQAKIEGLQEAANTSGGRLVFSTSASGSGSPTERMRITNGGNIFIGTTSSGGSGWTTANAGQQVVQYSATNDTRTLYEWKSDNAGSNTSAVYVESTGKLYARTTTVQAISSERRLKENIAPLDVNAAWETIKLVPFYSYNFIGADPSNVLYGPMADEVPDEMRVATSQSDDVGVIHTYDNGMLQARLYVALQAALNKIETLEAKVAALETA